MTDQPTPLTGEPQFNAHIARALERRHPLWRVGSEQTRTIRGDAALRPDILINFEHREGHPLIIEAEVEPASSVEHDARARLGVMLGQAGRRVEHVVALRLPARLRVLDQSNLDHAVESFPYGFVTWSLDEGGSPLRWPRCGWMRGGIDDLANLCENIALSEQRLAAGLSRLQHVVSDVAYRLRNYVPQGPRGTMASALHQEDGEQTSRMAAAIMVNAMVFHNSIAGHHDVPTIGQIRNESPIRRLSKSRVLRCWDAILEINYWPIFHIASDLLLPVPGRYANEMLEHMSEAVTDLSEIGVTTMHDLAGRMFQQLIADRKFLATFYTLPASAAMVAELACGRLDLDWRDPAAVSALRLADLACGTGTLLSAAYQAVRSRHRRAGGDDAAIHSRLMEQGLVAADVMPQAAHLTASMLSSAHPTVPFGNTLVYTMPYGRSDPSRPDHMSVGSLELLEKRRVTTLFATREQMSHGGGSGDPRELHLPHGSVDLVIMNPPFIRPTNHETAGVPVPSFAGLDNSEQEQRLMSRRLKSLRIGLEHPVGDGNAGLGSDFVDLAHVKLKEGGVLALVLPFTVIAGRSWRKVRELLAAHYTDIIVVSIAAARSTERAFSADTGMADAVIVATKKTDGGHDRALYVNLRRRPASLPEAVEVARLAGDAEPDETHGYLGVGGDPAAVWLRGALTADGGLAGLNEPGLALTMGALPRGRLVLPRGRNQPIPMATLAEIGREGPVDRDIGVRPGAKGEIRGPFEIHPISDVAEYPVLWGHQAGRERRMVVQPDSLGRARPGHHDRAVEVWNRAAGRLHFNRDFRLNSQSLAACFTPGHVIGGRAWPSFVPRNRSWEVPLLLWANTTLGLMCFWWIGSRQQLGRAVVTVTALPGLPVMDPRPLDDIRLQKANRVFEELVGLEFLPANESYRDQNRQHLDRMVLIDLLGLPVDILDPLDVLREQWCREPSVHGGKATSP